MSRENRRRSGAAALAERAEGRAATPPPEAPRAAAADGSSAVERPFPPKTELRAVAAGVVLGQLVLLLLTNGALVAADHAFGSQDTIDGGIVGTASFLAVILGAAFAARLAGTGRVGWWHGCLVGIGFVVIAVLYSFADEVRLVHDSFQITGGAHNLVDLGPMRIDQVISGDVLALFGGWVGGFLGRRR